MNQLKGDLSVLLKDQAVMTLIRFMEAHEHETRYVGGAVRDALIGRSFTDIDLATNVPPEMVMRILEGTGYKVIPTGLDHGTVTVVLGDQRTVEITSLREDVETYGRYAKTVWTDDWKADAARRDFTFNAISVDQYGRLYDYFGGRSDLAKGLVRFIGEPTERIKEDYLRILRFFRFYGGYGRGDINSEGLAACRKLADNIKTLARERIRQEIFKLLRYRNPIAALNHLSKDPFRAAIIDIMWNINKVSKLIDYEINIGNLSPMRRLFALWGDKEPRVIKKPLRLSNREVQTLKKIKDALDQISAGETIMKVAYRISKDRTIDALIIHFASNGLDKAELKQKIQRLTQTKIPDFPLDGVDLMEIGLQGSALGDALFKAEDYWLTENFKPDKQALMAWVREKVDPLSGDDSVGH